MLLEQSEVFWVRYLVDMMMEGKNMGNYENYRINDISAKIRRAGFAPLDVMVTGVTGAGKSTTLNTLFSEEVAEVGNGADPMTMELDSYRLSDCIRFWDTPGLGDGIAKDAEHSRKLIDLLWKTYKIDNKKYGFIDLALIIVDGSTRDMGTVYRLINNIVIPNIQHGRIIVAINQADMAMSGRHWDNDSNAPDPVLLEFLKEKSISVRKRIKEATGASVPMPVCYSAEKDYNIASFLDLIIDAIPSARRPITV